MGKARRKVEKLVFASAHAIVDPSSGAAVATNEAMQLLAQSRFQCQAFNAAMLDFPEEVCVEELLAKLGLPYEVRNAAEGAGTARILLTRSRNLPVTIFRNRFTQSGPVEREAAAFAAAYERFLDKNQPDAVLTYGGAPLGTIVARLAHRRNIPVVFALHNFGYHDVAPFCDVDYVVVPSEFSKAYYWERFGLRCQVLPNVIDPRRVGIRGSCQLARRVDQDREASEGPPEASSDQAGEWCDSQGSSHPTATAEGLGHVAPQYLTFVNPHPVKGLFVFARIAEQIARRRPEIPILVVDSRARGKALEETGLDLSWAKNLLILFGFTCHQACRTQPAPVSAARSPPCPGARHPLRRRSGQS